MNRKGEIIYDPLYKGTRLNFRPRPKDELLKLIEPKPVKPYRLDARGYLIESDEEDFPTI